MGRRPKTKTLQITIAMWTNNIPETVKKAVPDFKLAHESGVVYITRNNELGVSAKPIHFNLQSEIMGAIEESLLEAGVLLLDNEQARKRKIGRRKKVEIEA